VLVEVVGARVIIADARDLEIVRHFARQQLLALAVEFFDEALRFGFVRSSRLHRLAFGRIAAHQTGGAAGENQPGGKLEDSAAAERKRGGAFHARRDKARREAKSQ